MLSFYTTNKLDKQFKKIDKKIQEIFVNKLNFLLKDTKHPSINTEKLNYSLYSFRINKNFRVIFKHRNKEEIELIFIANHDVYKKIKGF